MSRLDTALDDWEPGTGPVTVGRPDGGEASVDVVDVDRLGVKVRGVTVGRSEAIEVVPEVHALPDRCRALPGSIEAQEVSPGLGGVLRTPLDKLRKGRFFEVTVTPQQTDVKRYEVANGERHKADWTMTREQLEELLDEL